MSGEAMMKGACGHNHVDCGCLSFAAAMALDPSEVECQLLTGDWLRLDRMSSHLEIADGRKLKWRRARPRRSRVQEMVDSYVDERGAACSLNVFTENAFRDAIRAVCEWLRDRALIPAEYSIGLAAHIEREFLEPR